MVSGGISGVEIHGVITRNFRHELSPHDGDEGFGLFRHQRLWRQMSIAHTRTPSRLMLRSKAGFE